MQDTWMLGNQSAIHRSIGFQTCIFNLLTGPFDGPVSGRQDANSGSLAASNWRANQPRNVMEGFVVVGVWRIA
jgi:hypothetical protein